VTQNPHHVSFCSSNSTKYDMPSPKSQSNFRPPPHSTPNPYSSPTVAANLRWKVPYDN